MAPYLDVPNIIKVCQEKGVTAVHPGYGFLAENVTFVKALDAAGIKFIGPNAKCIEMFGDKTASRKFAEEMNVEISRGSGILSDAKACVSFVKDKQLKYPVLLKAANGGGGKGQRIIRKEGELEDGFKKCAQEAAMA